MCRLLGYLGPSISLKSLLLEPSHSLVVQSYAPKELAVATLNADGFGFGWYHATEALPPFTYRNILPIWNDPNLEPLCHYITTGCAVAYVRSATAGQGVDMSNCQPFQSESLLFTHNGFIKRFRETLYRPMREMMSDRAYTAINGTTDSEHIWGLFLTALTTSPDISLEAALKTTLERLMKLAAEYDVQVAANVLLSDGKKLVGARLASHRPAPSLYWLKGDPQFPNAVLVASEPLFNGNWVSFQDCSLFTITSDCAIQFHPLDHLHSANSR